MRKSADLRLAAPALVLAVVFAAFLPALSAGFVDWDDDQNFTGNYRYRGLSPGNLLWMATTTHMGPYQPLSWLTLGIDHALWGMDPRGYHFTNVLLHALAAIAFLSLARTLLSRASPGSPARSLEWSAAFAAIVFAVHPLRVESVAWVTERRDVLSGFFFVLTVLAWLRGRRVLGCGLYLLCLLSKASGVALPLVLLLLDVWPLRRPFSRALVLEKLPLFALSLVFGLVAVVGQAGEKDAFLTLEQHGIGARAAQSGYALAFYVGKTLWPAGLSPMVEMPRALDPLAPRFLVPIALVAATAAGLWILRRRAPALAIAAGTYALLLAPTSGVLQAGAQLVADRYSYLPSLSLALLAGCGLRAWIDRSPEQAPYALQAAAGIALVLGALCFRQARAWRDSESLWTHALAIDPASPNALHNLGVLRLRQASDAASPRARRAALDEAEALFDRGLSVSPDAHLWINRGMVSFLRADEDPAGREERLREALGMVDRGFALSAAGVGPGPLHRFQRAAVLANLGRHEEARAELERCLRENPDLPSASMLLSVVLSNLERWGEALEQVDAGLALEPLDAGLWIRRGLLLEKLDRREEALGAFREAASAVERRLGPAARGDAAWRQAVGEMERLGAPPTSRDGRR